MKPCITLNSSKESGGGWIRSRTRIRQVPGLRRRNLWVAIGSWRRRGHAGGVVFQTEALDEVSRLTKDCPYFVQEWGYQSWKMATAGPITIDVVRGATAAVIPRLDRNFFRLRLDRPTPGEKNFLRAMAELGPGPQRTGDIVAKPGVKVTSLGPLRARLINKGMVYSPAYGEIAFTVPLFDEFMIRAMPEFNP